jgi:hypothetical protein
LDLAALSTPFPQRRRRDENGKDGGISPGGGENRKFPRRWSSSSLGFKEEEEEEKSMCQTKLPPPPHPLPQSCFIPVFPHDRLRSVFHTLRNPVSEEQARRCLVDGGSAV